MKNKYTYDEVPLNIKDFNLQYTEYGNAIHYKGIPLWVSVEKTLNGYLFAYYDPTLNTNFEDDPRCYMLVAIDTLGDRYHYGRWYSKEGFIEWLEHPYNIYNITEMEAYYYK